MDGVHLWSDSLHSAGVTDTIELDAGLRAVWRSKWLLLVGALICAAAAAGWTMLGPTRFTTSALVSMGRVMGEEIEDTYAVAQTINSPGFLAAVKSRTSGGPGSVNAEALTGGQGRLERPTLVRVTATAPTPEQAVATGQAAVDELVERHRSRFQTSEATYREYEKVLAVAGEPATGAADPVARRELFELRAKLKSPIFTAQTATRDPFPAPTAVSRNTAVVAGVAFISSLAILVIAAVAVGQARQPAA